MCNKVYIFIRDFVKNLYLKTKPHFNSYNICTSIFLCAISKEQKIPKSLNYLFISMWKHCMKSVKVNSVMLHIATTADVHGYCKHIS